MFVEVFMLALALAVDAFVVSFSYGLIIKKGKGRAALKLASATGGGQFVMPVLGWYGARMVYDSIAAVDHWIAFFVFSALGLKIIIDSQKNKCGNDVPKSSLLTWKVLFLIAVATSVDAFVSGSMLYFMNIPIWRAALLIGMVTFLLSIVGFNFCRIFKKINTSWLETASGIILILLGVKVLFEHLS